MDDDDLCKNVIECTPISATKVVTPNRQWTNDGSKFVYVVHNIKHPWVLLYTYHVMGSF